MQIMNVTMKPLDVILCVSRITDEQKSWKKEENSF